MTILDIVFNFPRIKKQFWQLIYYILGKYYSRDMLFMNYGYSNSAAPSNLVLSPEFEPYRLCVQLYQHLLVQINPDNKDILEIGCGNGGGVLYMATHFHPHTIVGVDLSKHLIENCRKLSMPANCSFQTGNAQALPFKNAQFDIVINVESSHCYPNVMEFYAEVLRVLKPGGWFLYTDLLDNNASNDIDILQKKIISSHFSIISMEEITPHVLAAMELNSTAREQYAKNNIPKLWQNFFLSFSGVKNTQVFNLMKTNKMKYFSAILKK